MEEKEIPLSCAKGDRRAQKILYDAYAEYLYGICLRYMGSRDEALDLLHDVFIKVYGNISRFSYKGPGSLKAWLARVTVNAALEELRRKNRFRTVEISKSGIQDYPDEQPVEQIPPKVLMRFISELPPGYRTVFNLFVFEGLPHREIAAMLGINEKSSSSQLLRAKAALARKVNEYLKRDK